MLYTVSFKQMQYATGLSNLRNPGTYRCSDCTLAHVGNTNAVYKARNKLQKRSKRYHTINPANLGENDTFFQSRKVFGFTEGSF